MVFAPELQHDPESSTWSYFKSFEWGFERYSTEGMIALAKSNTMGGQQAAPAASASNQAPAAALQDEKSQKDILERLGGIIDTEEPRFQKVKEECFTSWEQNIGTQCEGMNSAIDHYYDRQNFVFDRIQETVVDKRELNIPELDENEKCDELRDLATGPWNFQSISGQSQIKSTEQIQAFNQRLKDMQALSFWNEPIDIMNGGPEFLEKAKKVLLTKSAKFDADLKIKLSECLAALFSTTMLSGNYDLIVEALDTLIQFNNVYKGEEADAVFQRVEVQMTDCLKHIVKKVNEAPYEHALLKNDVSRVFGVANLFPVSNLNTRNISLTSDGSYLYLAIGVTKRAFLFKIGSGEMNTIPGKVYVQTPLERDGDLTWVYCNSKLYLRYVSGEIGALHIFDPATLQKTGEGKLFLADMPNLQACEAANRSYPLLVDPIDGHLCIVSCEVEKRERKVLPEHQEKHAKCVLKRGEDKAQKESEQAAAESEVKAEQLKRQKSEKQKRKEQPKQNEDDKNTQLIDCGQYAALVFRVHKFDVTGSFTPTYTDIQGGKGKSEAELLKEPLVEEMYHTFSGYFKIPDCARALKQNRQDIEAAANWLVAEKEKPNQQAFKRLSSTFLTESQLVNSTEPEKYDWMVFPGSQMQHTCVATGRWTIGPGQITYNYCPSERPEQSSAMIFSLEGASKAQSEKQVETTGLQERIQARQSNNFGIPSGFVQARYYLIEDKWIKLSDRQIMAKIEDLKSKEKSVEDIFDEETLYEQIVLNTACIKSLTQMKSLSDQSYAEYTTYCIESKRFYTMIIGHQNRLIRSSRDQHLQTPTSELKVEKSQNLEMLVRQALKLLMQANQQRVRMPWRWNLWQKLYQQQCGPSTASTHSFHRRESQLFGSSQYDEDGMRDPYNFSHNDQLTEQQKAISKKLKKRHVMLKEHFTVTEINRAGIKHDLTANQIDNFKQKTEKKIKQYKKDIEIEAKKTFYNKAGIEMKPGKGSCAVKLYCGRYLGCDIIPHSDGGCGPTNGPQCPDCQAVAQDYQNVLNRKNFDPLEQVALPTEQVCVPTELCKQYAFCTTGNIRALDSLMSFYQACQQDDKHLVLENILQWATHATWLAGCNNPSVHKLCEICIQICKEQKDEKILSLAMRILVVGWQFFSINALKQIEIIHSILATSMTDQEQADQIPSVDLLLDSSIRVSGQSLLRARFCHQASFYDLESLNRRVIHNFYFVLKGVHLNIHSSAKAVKDDPPSINLLNYTRSKWHKVEEPSHSMLGKLEVSPLSLSEVPVEYISARKINNRIGGDSSCISPSYFNVPLACCLSKELINGQFELKNSDIDMFISFYTDQKPKQASPTQEQKFIFFNEVRAEFATKQKALMSVIKQKMQKGCEATSKVFSHIVGQALDWIDFQLPSQTDLLLEVLDIAIQTPSVPLVSQLLICFSKCIDQVASASVANSCLPKLISLIGILSKDQKIRIDETVQEGVDDSYEKIYETQHPYPRSEYKYPKSIKVPGAIGYTVEFDRRCKVESGHDTLVVRSSDYNQQISERVGTDFRFDQAPSADQVYVIYGKQLDLEFRSQNPRGRPPPRRGRGGGQAAGDSGAVSREDLQKRWGYRVTVKPIFGSPKTIEGDPAVVSILNNLVQLATKLSSVMVEAQFVREDEERTKNVVTSESSQAITKVLNWHLFKGGLKVPELESLGDSDQILQHGLKKIAQVAEDQFMKSFKSLQDDVVNDESSKDKEKSAPENAPAKDDALDMIDTVSRNSQSVKKSKFVPQTSVWEHEIKSLQESGGFKKILQRIRIQVPLPLIIANEYRFRMYFKKNYACWEEVESLLLMSMLYHSGSVSDAVKYAEIEEQIVRHGLPEKAYAEWLEEKKEEMKNMTPEELEEEESQEKKQLIDDETSQLFEEFKIIGMYINQVLLWMFARLGSQKEFQKIMASTLEFAQEIITERLRVKSEVDQMAAAETEMRQYIKDLEEYNLQKQKEESQAIQDKETKKNKQVAAVTVSKTKVNTKKRSNVIKISNQLAQNAKKPSKAKKSAKIEESKEEDVPEAASKVVEPPKFIDLPNQELIDLKSKIISQTYQRFADSFLDEDEGFKMKPLLNLCNFFDLDFNANDVSSSLQAVFKRVKNGIKAVLDLNDTESDAQKVQCSVSVDDLNLKEPASQVTVDVTQRLQLLLEIKPSFSYLSEVTRISRQKTKMNTILEQDEDAQSQISERMQQNQSQVSQNDSDLSEEFTDDLPPLAPLGRSMSLPNTIQSGIAKLAGTQKPLTRARTRKQSEEYAQFIDSYRKWRLWAKRSADEEEDLMSPNGSPLHGVISFAKMTKIDDCETIRTQMRQHVVKAAFRLTGLCYQEKLFALLSDSPLLKYVWGTKGQSLHKSVLNKINTCGESLTRQLNAVTRQIVQQLMSHFVQQIKSINQRQTLHRPSSKSSKKHYGLQRQETVGSDPGFQTQSTIISTQTTTIQSQPTTTTQANQANLQPVSLVDCKRLLLTLNDIRVLMSNIYTKEYVLESLRADKHISTRNTLGIEQIKLFLRAVVNILVKCQNNQAMLSPLISQESKLVLRLFTNRQSDTTVKSETQRILHEMLLDTVVSQLEQEYAKSEFVNKAASKQKDLLSTQQSSVNAILKLLSEVLRINSSKDSNNEIQSQKAQGCIKLLAQLITSSSETPAVVRQAIKCAKLLIKQMGSSFQDPGFATDILKSIGDKIQSYQQPKAADSDAKEETEEVKEVPQKTVNDNYVMVHVNMPQDEDYTFLVTALWEWEKRHPVHSNKLHKSLNEIVKIVPPAPPAKPAKEAPAKKEKKEMPEKPWKKGKKGEAQKVEEVKEVAADKDKEEEVKSDVKDAEKKPEEVKSDVQDADKKPEEVKSDVQDADKKPEEVKSDVQDADKKSEEVKSDVQDADKKSEEVKSDVQDADKKAEEVKDSADKKPEEVNDSPADKKPEEVKDEAADKEKSEILEEKKVEVSDEEVKVDKKDEDKDWQTDSDKSDKKPAQSTDKKPSDEPQVDKKSEDELKMPQVIQEKMNEEKAKIISQMQSMMQDLNAGEQEQDRDLFLHMKHQELEKLMTSERNSEEVPPADGKRQESFLKMYQEALGRGPPGMPPRGPPSSFANSAFQPAKEHSHSKQEPRPTQVQPPAAIKLQHVLNACTEVKNNWQPPLSTDSAEVQERKLKERNYQILACLIINEAVQTASHLFARNSVPINRQLSSEQANEFCNILKLAYAQQIEPLQLNPHTPAEEAAKPCACVKHPFKDLFPLTPKIIKLVDKPASRAPEIQLLKRIAVAPQRFSVSIVQKSLIQSLEKEMNAKLTEIKACHKSHLKHGPIIHSRSKKILLGHSMSNIISDLVLFVRSMPAEALNNIFESSLQGYLNGQYNNSLLYGIIATIGGWQSHQSTGTLVDVNINEQWYAGTVIDGGNGKSKMIVILDDETLTLHKVAHKNVRTYVEPLKLVPNQALMIKAVIKAKDDKFLLCLLLRACAHIKLEISQDNTEYQSFLKILVEVSNFSSIFNEDKTQEEWERQMMFSWEKLLESREYKNQLFSTSREAVKKDSNAEQGQVVEHKTQIENNDYIQPMNSYLLGLPDLITISNKAESKLKCLHYWEKHIIPAIINYCQGTHKGWELNLSLEQVRHSLKQGMIDVATADMMVLMERRIPPTLFVPDENHEWSTKIIDECIVGNWYLAKIKQRSSSESVHSSQFAMVLSKLQSLGIEEILVQVKAVDARSSAVLAEYTDYDMMQTHYVWLPVLNLMSLQNPLPVNTIQPVEQLTDQFNFNIQKVASIYSRRTLEKFAHDQKEIPIDELKFEEMISWSAWENFSNNPVNGWMQDLPSVLSLSKNHDARESQDGADKSKSLYQILNQTIEKIAHQNLVSQQIAQSKKQSDSSLTMLADMLKTSQERQKQMFEWTSTLWYKMAQSVSQDRCVLDLFEEYDKFTKTSSQTNGLLPLHELLPNKGDQSIGNLLQFKKGGIKMSPCSRIQFFSDPEQVNLVEEINGGNDFCTYLSPVVLEYSRVWVSCYAGTNALLSQNDQEQLKDGRSNLETAVVSIPKEWQIACWLTETLTTIEIQRETITQDSQEVFKTLITAMLAFYDDAKAPNILKSCILKLLSRLVIKLRYLHSKLNTKGNEYFKDQTHLQISGITQDFLQNLQSEIMIQMESSNNLHGAFVQDAVEFMMSFVIPIGKQASQLTSYRDMLSQQIEIPDWMAPSLRLSFYLHYFRGDIAELPKDMVSVKAQQDCLEQIIALPLEGMPEEFSHEWLMEQTKEILRAHQALILKPKQDLVIYKGYLVIIIDGWHPLKPQEVQEVDDSDEDDGKPKKEKKKEPEIPPLEVYNCAACTMENPISVSECQICATPKPAMGVLEEEHNRKYAPVEVKKEIKESEPQLNQLRTQALCKDLKQIVSRPQRKKLVELAAKAEAEKAAAQAEAERVAKEEAEKAAKEAAQKAEEKKDSKEEEKKDEPEKEKEQPKEKKEEPAAEKEASEKSGSDEESEEEKEEIDLDNLPADRAERLRLLDVDVSFLDPSEEQMIKIMEDSAIEELRKQQEKRASEREKKQQEREAIKKQKEKERVNKLLKAQNNDMPAMFKFNVHHGETAMQSSEIGPVIQELLISRFRDQNDFNKRAKEVISQIHENWKTHKDLPLPQVEEGQQCILDDMGFTKSQLPNFSAQELEETLGTMLDADATLFIKFIYSQGYDLWLTQTNYPQKPSQKQITLTRTVFLLEKLKKLIEHDMCMESKLVQILPPHELRLTSLLGEEFNEGLNYYDESNVSYDYPDLCEQLSQVDARYMWAMLKNFNEYYAPVIPFVNQQDSGASNHSSDQSILPMGIAAYISATRDLCFNSVKTDLGQLILEKTTVQRDHPPKLYFERLKLADQSQNDPSGDRQPSGQQSASQAEQPKEKASVQSMFDMAHDQIQDLDIGLLRPTKPTGSVPHIAFEIVFKNEHVVGEGGPYRQFFADVSKELQPTSLELDTNNNLMNLLGPCANQREKEKQGKDRFVIKSQANNQRQLSQFEFLGVLMGVCIRTGSTLILDLPSMFWKELVGQKITLDDFNEIETKLTLNLSTLLSETKAEFQENPRQWQVTLADGEKVDLKPDGANTILKYEEIEEYVRAVIETRLKESQLQYQAIKRGIAKIIPKSLLNIMTSKELEIWVCGKNIIDVELLSRHTKYSGEYEVEHPVMKMFWRMMNEMLESDRQKFIKFCWGQERIPPNDASFSAQNVRMMIKMAPKTETQEQMDMKLPTADTCFFNLTMPVYSSFEIMLKKVMQAIYMDNVSMNAEEAQVGEDQARMNQFSEDESY